MQERHRADQATLDEFADEVLVVCPACERSATVRLVPLEEQLRAGPLRTQVDGRLVCSHCGHNARKPAFVRWINEPADSVFGRPVWLQIPCCGHTLWAYNGPHLAALEEFVRAGLRERRQNPETGWRNKAWVSRIPRWLSAAKNREEVLRCISRLRQERLGSRD
jgi:hypothetical protein